MVPAVPALITSHLIVVSLQLMNFVKEVAAEYPVLGKTDDVQQEDNAVKLPRCAERG